MGNTLKVKRGTNLSNAGTPAAGELIYKTDTNELFVGDGSTAATGLSAIGGSGSGDIEGVTAGVGLSGGGSSGTVSLAVDLSELTDMTASVNSSEDELIILDNGADRRKLISEIPLSAFNNDSGFITSTLTTEQVQDIVGAMFSSNTETRITATYQDSDGTIDLVVDDLDTDTQLTTENVQDIVGAMFSSNTETRISATYQDGDGTIDLVVDDMTANDNTVTTNIAGTGISVSSGTGNSTISTNDSEIVHDNLSGFVANEHINHSSVSILGGAGLTGGGTIAASRNIHVGAGTGITVNTDDVAINFKDEDDMSSNSASHAATQQSIKAYVDAEVAGIVNSAPSALNTLDELAAALGDDANFATTTSTSLGNRLRVDTASQGLTGTQQANAITNLGITATKAELNYVDGVTSAIQTQLDAKLTSSSSLNGSNISSGTVAAARIANLAASKITSGTFDTARIPSTIFKENLGTITGGTDTENAKATGLYRVSETGHSTMLVSFTGVSGSTQSLELYAHYNDELYFRTGRDSETEFDSVGRYDNKIWHSGNDGSSSGLDADLLDGQQGSSYMRSDSNQDFSGTLSYTPDTGTILSVDGQAIIQRMTANGAITIGHDDAVIIAGGDTSGVMNTNINNATETVFVGAEGGLVVYAFPSNNTSWSNRKELSYNGTALDVEGNITVSGTVDGRDVASDGSKLDGIESGATADQSASEILTAIKTVDGGGSGLDADTVDGIQASGFLRSNAGDTAAGNITFTAKLLGDTSTTSILNGANVSNVNDGFTNDIGTGKAAGLQPFRYSNTTTNTPLGGSGSMANNANWGLSLYSHGTGGGGNYGLQMSGGDNDNQLFFIRRVSNGSFGSWFEVWHSGNDGGGSGLDADKLDGIQSSSFLRSDATDTASGAITLSNFVSFTMDGNTITGIDDSGEFTNNDSHIMTSAAVEDKILGYGYTTNTGNVTSGSTVDFNNLTCDQIGVNVSANGTDGRIDAGNDIVAFSTSDKRLKENIKPLDNALDKVLKISGVSFDWKPLTEEEKKTIHGNQGHDVGVIAQEIEEVLPEVVTTRDSGYKAVKYEKIVPLLIESIKELKAEIEELKK